MASQPPTDAPGSQPSRAMRVRLFIKPFCGWCRQAKAWLDQQGVAYDLIDVTSDSRAWDEMVALSGQTLAPVIEVDGKVLADFGAAELAVWWKQHFGPS